MPPKITITIKKRPTKIRPVIVKKNPINWNTIQRRAGKKGLNSGLGSADISALWRTRPDTWDKVNSFILGKQKLIHDAKVAGLDRSTIDDLLLLYDATYIESGTVQGLETLYRDRRVPVNDVTDFEALKGRYKVKYGQTVYEVFLNGGVKNFKDFFYEFDSGTSVALDEIGRLIAERNFGAISFTLIESRSPDKTQAKKNAERYNRKGFHCLWTPIMLTAQQKLTNSMEGRPYSALNKDQRKRYKRLVDAVEYWRGLADGTATDSETIQRICHDKNIRITIEYVGFDDDNIETFARADTHCRDIYKFICVRSDHVEWVDRKIERDIILDEEQFRERLASEPMIHPVKINNAGGSRESRIYSFESYSENVRYILKGYEQFLDPNSDVMKYMSDIKARFGMPDDIPVSKLIRCSMRNPGHTYREGFYMEGDSPESGITPGLWETDARRCYANFRMSPYYKGAPGKINCWRYDPDSDIYLNYPGFWYIECHDKVPFLEDLNGAWTTIALKYFTEMGIKFTVMYGAWSLHWVDLPEFSSEIIENKTYPILVGLFQQKGEGERVSNWLDPEHVISGDSGLKATKKKYKGLNCNIAAAYFLDYAWTRVHERAMATDAVAIFTDAIITRDALPDQDGWKSSVPLEDKEIHPIPRYLNNKAISESIDPRPANFPYKNYEHELHLDGSDSMAIYLSGAGGTGKTTTIMDQFRYIGVSYSSLTKRLVEEFKTPGKFRNGTNIHNLASQRWLPGVIIIDEVSQLAYSGKFGIEDLMKITESGIRLYFAGDRAQISINGNFNITDTPGQMWKYLESLPTYNFQNDRRSKDMDTRIFKNTLRDIVLSGDPEVCDDAKISRIRRHLASAKCRPKDFKGLTIGNRSRKENEEGYESIDKMQGVTVDYPYCVRVDGCTARGDVFHKLVYTGVSRTTNIGNMYIQDITDWRKEKNKV